MSNNADGNPFLLFAKWYEEAQSCGLLDPTAVSLATASKEGRPSNRTVLLKGFDERGFVIYTNLKSRKSCDLIENPLASLCFYWMPLEKQVRVEGKVEPVTDAEADAYFASRPFQSRVGAWASKQSQPLPNRSDLLKRVAEFTAKFAVTGISRPPFWSGYRIVPDYIEFWKKGEYRLHDRSLFRLVEGCWKHSLLYP